MSTINAIIATFVSLFGLFHNDYFKKLYLNLNGTNHPGIPFYVYAQMSGYMIIDSLTETILYCWYKNSQRFRFKYDWGSMLHHILVLATCFTFIPHPIYYWFMISLWPIIEMSTIFLNINKLARYYDFLKPWKPLSMTCFLFTWFCVRIPIICISIWR
eukprot:390304_1